MKLKIGAFEITFSKKWIYTLIVIGILGIVAIGVYASASDPPPKPTGNPSTIPNPGHPASEINFSGGINGNVIVNGKIGIGTTNPKTELEIKGKITTNELCFSNDCKSDWNTSSEKLYFGNIPKIIMWSHTVIALQGEKLSCSHLCSSEPGVKLNTGQCIAAWDGSKNIIDCNEENSKISCSCQGIAA